jgi:hypothetical protein
MCSRSCSADIRAQKLDTKVNKCRRAMNAREDKSCKKTRKKLQVTERIHRYFPIPISYCHVSGVPRDEITGSGSDDWIYWHSVTISLNYKQAISDLHNLLFTVAHTLGFSVSTSRILATDLNTGKITSNHYEVFFYPIFFYRLRAGWLTNLCGFPAEVNEFCPIKWTPLALSPGL